MSREQPSLLVHEVSVYIHVLTQHKRRAHQHGVRHSNSVDTGACSLFSCCYGPGFAGMQKEYILCDCGQLKNLLSATYVKYDCKLITCKSHPSTWTERRKHHHTVAHYCQHTRLGTYPWSHPLPDFCMPCITQCMVNMPQGYAMDADSCCWP